MKKSKPFSHSMTTITADECVSLQDTIKQWDVPAREKELVLRALHTLLVLFQKLATLKMTIKQLRTMFQIKTEKTDKLYPSRDTGDPASDKADDLPPDVDEQPHTDSSPQVKKKRTGHGRRPAADYPGATTITITHETLSAGARCPGCHRGNIYDYSGPGFVRIEATAPLQATIYKQQTFRCATCGELYHAPLPENIAAKMKEKWSSSAQAMIALLKYGCGFPYHRLAGLQKDLGVPLPSSTQWDVVVRLAERIHPVYWALCDLAAQGEVIDNDDTFARVVQIDPPEATGHRFDRTGIFTTGIVSKVGQKTISLYCTGRNHAGENITDLLTRRLSGLDPPIQMCDAAARNKPANIKTVLAHCLVHGRRKFVQIMSSFPDPSRFVIEQLAKVFNHDKEARERGYNDRQRLLHHQKKSEPIMKELKTWMVEQFDNRLVENESSLGKAFHYLLNNWTELTLFLKVEGAPLHSNIVERALKKAILNRKNAYFYRTEYGAMVGDLIMSLIETCRLAGGDPFHYLIALQEHADELQHNPTMWLPWNYQQNKNEQREAA
jgi:transposase